jgi:hypothetical protein
VTVIAATEGAVVLCRARPSVEPSEEVHGVLHFSRGVFLRRVSVDLCAATDTRRICATNRDEA